MPRYELLYENKVLCEVEGKTEEEAFDKAINDITVSVGTTTISYKDKTVWSEWQDMDNVYELEDQILQKIEIEEVPE